MAAIRWSGSSEVRVGDGSDGGHAAARVEPDRARRLFVDIREVEDWTLNGPYLDGISFVTGLKDGKALVRQRSRDDRQVPKFRSDMTAPEIAAMLESLFRVRGGAVDFRTPRSRRGRSSAPTASSSIIEHLDSDEVWRRGPRGRRGDRRPALPDPVRRGAIALLRRVAARLRSDRELGSRGV